MSNFFDNFMGGLAFGMLSSNPFFGGMYGFGFGGGMYINRVDFETFANPFPSIFSDVSGYANYNVQMPLNDFINPSYPLIDFNEIGETILNMSKIPNFNTGLTFPWFQQPEVNNPAKKEGSELEEQEPEKNDEKTEISYDAKALKEKWSKKQPQLKDQFYSRVVEISQKVKCSPDDLMALMNLETRRTFSPSEKNPKSTATGLIQFTEGTAKTLGTSIQKLKKMTPVQQLDYVEKYLVHWKKEVGFGQDEQLSAGDLYALVAQPANAKKEVLIVAGTDAYEKNKKNWDRNNDKKITKTELSECLNDFRA